MKNYILLMVAVFAVVMASNAQATWLTESTPQMMGLVKDASALIQIKGEAAFSDFRVPGSRWREGETYIFVLNPAGDMLVHPDPAMEGKNQLGLEDVNGKPIIRGLLAAATTFADKPEGWYHYQWPVPDGLLPRWKSSYVQLTKAPSGKSYVVGCGNYNDRMEREFVVDAVNAAVAQIQLQGKEAFQLFYDPAGPFRAKDAYIFVFDRMGVDLVNPAFPNLEGRNLMDLKDAQGKFLVRDMFKVVNANGAGWVDYMWPKPGESVSTLKSAYVSQAKVGDQWLLVGCGIYLADAPKAVANTKKMTAPEMMALVRDAAVVFEKSGENAFPEFRINGSKWFLDDRYFFVWTMDGTRYFHAANPAGEGANMNYAKDVLGRPMGKMILETGASAAGEGWVHYMYPEPGSIFPTWKSSFVKRVRFPSGKEYIIGSGIYNMQMDKTFIEDVVNRAAVLVADQGPAAFDQLRDKKGPFVFMDTYVFVNNLAGLELVNGAQPSLEGKNLLDHRDIKGKLVVREYLDAAVKKGQAWVDYYWYRPGDNAITQKYTFVREVKYGGTTYVLGAGLYEPDQTKDRPDLGVKILKKQEAAPQVQDDRSVVVEEPEYEFQETKELVELVNDAADLIRSKGKSGFADFRIPDSRWRKGETYIFVLNPAGDMLVHSDPALEGKNQLNLKDVNGKPIIKGLIAAATTFSDKPEGWYHYQWPVPGGLLPRWKSSYVRLAKDPSGNPYIVGSGVYNDRMERVFLVDAVKSAVKEVEQRGKAAFASFYDPKGPYIVKDAYIWVNDMNGVEMVNPAFPNLEGRKLLDNADVNGKYVYRELIQIVKAKGEGWIDYMWPKPGESVPTLKSAYVQAARMGDQTVVVGCGAYLSEAPTTTLREPTMTAAELASFVREAAAMLEQEGEKAYAMFRQKGSRWFSGDTYLFTFDLNGVNTFHAAEPETVGRQDRDLTDIMGRPIVKMMLDAGATTFGEGWVHYMYPEPGAMFPIWKSSYVKRVLFPSGKEYIVGSGIYNMQMNKAFIEDVVNRAATLIADNGQSAFDQLRDKKGPFVFMDTYVFVLSPEGIELVNGGMPSLEGKNLIDLKDLQGRPAIRDEIAAAMTEGSAWLEFYWYLPGENTPALKQTYVRKVRHNGKTYIVGSGLYGGNGPVTGEDQPHVRKLNWNNITSERLSDKLSRQTIYGDKATLAHFTAEAGARVARHYHANEEYSCVVSGTLKFHFDDWDVVVKAGEVVIIPPNVPHSVVAEEDAVFIDFFVPLREDWLKGEDQYLRL